ncbi:MAG: hypothetical protein ABIU09_09430 [Pyrinomonadaceae bacterium]
MFGWLFIGASFNIWGQTVVDMTVATVSDGVRTELITYSDLRWQLALQPNVQLSPPSSDDLNGALQRLINQRIFALEADRLPRSAPTDKEIDAETLRVLGQFPSTAEFERRLRIVGFESVKDSNLERLITQRISIEKYLDFRFRSFIVNTPEDEAKYYADKFVPDFRRRFPGLLVPALDEKRAEIDTLLTESKVIVNIEAFLDDAKRRIAVVVLNAV